MHIGKKTLFLLSFFVIGLIIGTREVVKKQSLSSMKAWSTFSELPPIEEIQVSKVPQNNINNDIIQNNETYVPSYWKYGVNTDSQDYLKGYLPNIRNFKEYWNIYINSYMEPPLLMAPSQLKKYSHILKKTIITDK